MPEIKQYAVRFHGGPKAQGTGMRAQVHLFGVDNRLIGEIHFMDDGLLLPEDVSEPRLIMALPVSMLDNVVDLLRNEGPVFIEWQAKIDNVYLGTSQEPVGEGE